MGHERIFLKYLERIFCPFTFDPTTDKTMTDNFTQDRTIFDLCKDMGRNIDSVARQFNRKFPTKTFSRDYVPDITEVEKLFPTKGQRPTTKPTLPVKKNLEKAVVYERPTKSELSKPKQTESWFAQNFAFLKRFDTFLQTIIYGHSALVTWDLWALYKQPGIIAAVIAVVFKHASVKLVQTELNRTAQNALIGSVLIDLLCWWIHYLAFGMSMENVENLTPYAANVTSGVLAGFVVACSSYSLYLIYDSKQV